MCPPTAVMKYRAKLSGPLIDRIDLHVEVPALNIEEISGETTRSEKTSDIRLRVIRARARQRERLSPHGLFENGQMGVRHVRAFCPLESDARLILRTAIQKMGLSARAYDRILRVSRTIADLDESDKIGTAHVAEAVGYRLLDRAVQAPG